MKTSLLLIEDDEIIRENTAEILELSNYEVTTASNGKQGIEVAKRIQPDLIVCDIMMPEMDGYQVLNDLSKNPQTSTIPFIFLTAKTEKNEVRKGMALGADDYITKPFDEDELLEAIKGRLKRSNTIKERIAKDINGLSNFAENGNGLAGLEELNLSKQVKAYKKKETIYFEGDYPNVLYFLKSGKVKTFRLHDDAKEYITGVLTEGEYFGYLPILERRSYDECAVALKETEVYKISKKDFLNLIQTNRDVAANFIKLISNNLIEREQKLLSLAYDSVRKRTANALLDLESKIEDGKPKYIDVLRSDLASMVGTASESVIRTLSDFKEEHLIEIHGKEILIKNRTGLMRVW
ncbi:MAG: transcriptional regulator [Verrucomicrobia bacterium]|nr:transcriptional regulator [Verrucomicrobiota bacterium]